MKAIAVPESVGVNIHLHSTNTVYNNFPLIQNLLTNLGVKHTRDGMVDTTWQPFYQRQAALAKLGIRCLFITSPTLSDQVLTEYPERVGGALEGYEAPNEYDQSGDPNWAGTLNAFVPRLHSVVKSNRVTAQFPIVAPVLTSVPDYARIAGLDPYFDYSNMHNYFGGHNPGTTGWGNDGYGSILWNLAITNQAWPNKMVMTTETGYISDLSIPQSIPEEVEGKYEPRIILEQLRHGIQRTYLYELIDEGNVVGHNSSAFGLARNDGSLKPAYVALKTLLSTFADSDTSFTPENLNYSLPGASNAVHHLLFQKSDGSYYLAFWLEASDYDQIGRKYVSVAPQTLTFSSNRVFRTTQLLTFSASGGVGTRELTPSANISLPVTDCISILRLK